MSYDASARLAALAAEGRLLNSSGQKVVIPQASASTASVLTAESGAIPKPSKKERKALNRGKKHLSLVPMNTTTTVPQSAPIPAVSAWASAVAPRALWSVSAANQQPITTAHPPGMYVYLYLTHEGNLPLHYDASVYNHATRSVGELANVVHDIMYKIASPGVPNTFLEFVWSVWGNFFRSALSGTYTEGKKMNEGNEFRYPLFQIDPFVKRFNCDCADKLPRMATTQKLHVTVSRPSEGKKKFLDDIIRGYYDEIHQLEACCEQALKRNIVRALRITCTKDIPEGAPNVEAINRNIDMLIADLTTIAKYVSVNNFTPEDMPKTANINYTDISLMQDRIYSNLRVNDRTNLFNFRTRHLQNMFVCGTTSKDGVEVLRRARKAVFSKVSLLFAHRIRSVRLAILDGNGSVMMFKDDSNKMRPAQDDVHIPLRPELAVTITDGFEMLVAQPRIDVMSPECRDFGGFFPTLEWYLELDGIRDDTHSKASVIRDLLIRITGYPAELFRTNVGDYGIEFLSGHAALDGMMEQMSTSRKAMKLLIRIIHTLEEHLNARCTEPHLMRITFIYKCKRTIYVMAPYEKRIRGLCTGAVATFERCITANWGDIEAEEIDERLAAEARTGNTGYHG